MRMILKDKPEEEEYLCGIRNSSCLVIEDGHVKPRHLLTHKSPTTIEYGPP